MDGKFWKATGIRALRTFCEVFAGYLSGAAILQEVDWKIAFSAAALGTIYAVVMAVATGLPEAKE